MDFKADSKYYFLLLYGSMGISLGLVLYGYRVITMMGSRVTQRCSTNVHMYKYNVQCTHINFFYTG